MARFLRNSGRDFRARFAGVCVVVGIGQSIQYQNDFGDFMAWRALLVVVGLACTFHFADALVLAQSVCSCFIYRPQVWVVFLFGVGYVCGAYGNCL